MKKHPHPERLAEIYRRGDERLIFIGYTADPPPHASWDATVQAWVVDDSEAP